MRTSTQSVQNTNAKYDRNASGGDVIFLGCCCDRDHMKTPQTNGDQRNAHQPFRTCGDLFHRHRLPEHERQDANDCHTHRMPQTPMYT